MIAARLSLAERLASVSRSSPPKSADDPLPQALQPGYGTAQTRHEQLSKMPPFCSLHEHVSNLEETTMHEHLSAASQSGSGWQE